MEKLQISPSFLIGHIYYYGEVFERVLGEERAKRTDPLKSAFKYGLTPTIHSDYNCQPVDPLRCIYNAVTRRVLSTKKVLNEDECVSPYQAVQAMTINAAWQCHMEDIVGSIEGFKALSDLHCVGRGVFAGGNPVLDAGPEAVGRDPHGTGWLYAFEGEAGADFLDVDGYCRVLDQTIDRLMAAEKQQDEAR